MALLTIYYGFLDNFLQLFCFAFCAVQNLSCAVQKSDYLFRGRGVKVSPRTALLLSKIENGTKNGGRCNSGLTAYLFLENYT
jgi:hypothetical protein